MKSPGLQAESVRSRENRAAQPNGRKWPRQAATRDGHSRNTVSPSFVATASASSISSNSSLSALDHARQDFSGLPSLHEDA